MLDLFPRPLLCRIQSSLETQYQSIGAWNYLKWWIVGNEEQKLKCIDVIYYLNSATLLTIEHLLNKYTTRYKICRTRSWHDVVHVVEGVLLLNDDRRCVVIQINV